MADGQRDLLITLALNTLNADQLDHVEQTMGRIAQKDGEVTTQSVNVEFPGGQRVLSLLHNIGQLSEESFGNLSKMLSGAKTGVGQFSQEIENSQTKVNALTAEIAELARLQGILSDPAKLKQMSGRDIGAMLIDADTRYDLANRPGGKLEDKIGPLLAEKQAALAAEQAALTGKSVAQEGSNVQTGEAVTLERVLVEIEKTRAKGLDNTKRKVRELSKEVERLNTAMAATANTAAANMEQHFTALTAEIRNLREELAKGITVKQAPKAPIDPAIVAQREAAREAKRLAKEQEIEAKKNQSLLSRYIDSSGQGGTGSKLLGRAAFATARLSFYLLAAKLLFGVQAALRAAVTTSVDFEKVLAEIQGVLPSKSQMEAFKVGEAAIASAKTYGVSILEAAESAKIFAQTGKNASEVAKAMEASLIAVRGANLGIAQAQELIIAIEKISEGEVEALEILDKISRVESRRAITATELATGLQRIGPVVRQLRGDMRGLVDEFDVAMGAVTTIVEATRVSGQAAATSLKFVLSRFGNPQVIKNIQRMTGVGFAREGGKELRPYVEILHELSAAYQELQNTGRSGKAFELLTVLGGSRQIQSTAKLLENFSRDTLSTARLASMAFNDATQRTAISLNTVDARVKQVSASWGYLSTAVINSTAVNYTIKDTLRALSAALTGTGHAVKYLDAIFGDSMQNIGNFFGGNKSKYNAEFLDLSNVDPKKVPRLNAFNEEANNANMTSTKLLENITAIGHELASAVGAEGGGSITEVLQKLDDVSTGDSLRHLHETMGTRLADALATTIPRFADMKKAIEETEDPTLKAKMAADRLTQAYTLLANAAYVSNAVMATNVTTLQNTISSFVDITADKLREGLNGSTWMAEWGFKDNTLDQFFTNINDNLDIALTGIGGRIFGIGDEFVFLTKSLFGATDATKMWQESIKEAFDEGISGDSYKIVLDKFSQKIVGDATAHQQAVDVLSARLNDVIIGKGLKGGSVLTGGTAGELFVSNFTKLLSEAGQKLIETQTLGAGANKEIEALLAALNDPGARSSDFLTTLDRSLSSIRSKILELLTTYAIATDSNRELAKSYGEINIFFDKQASDLTAAKTLFESLSKIQNELRKEIVLTDKQYQSLTITINDIISGSGIGGLSPEVVAGLSEGIDIEQLSDQQQQTVQKMRDKLTQYRNELALLSHDSLLDIFGSSEEAAHFVNLLNNALSDSSKTAKDALISFFALTSVTQGQVGVLEQLTVQRQLDTKELQAQASIIQASAQVRQASIGSDAKEATSEAQRRSGITSKLLSMSQQLTPVINEQLVLEQTIYAIERNRISGIYQSKVNTANAVVDATKEALLNEFGSLEVAQAKDALLAAQLTYNADITAAGNEQTRQLREALTLLEEGRKKALGENLLNAYSEFASQVQQNAESAFSGFRKLLTDVNTFKSGNGINEVLAPIGETFVGRIADNFVKDLASSTAVQGLFETPETLLADRLREAAQAGGASIATDFMAAGELVASRIATAMGTTLPPSPGGVLGNTPGGKPKSGLALSRSQQLMALGGSMGGSLIGDQIGNAATAQIGAQLGTAVGTFLLPGVGSLAGGLIGGALGGLLGGDDAESKNQTQALQKIEQNTSRSADVLELERRFLEVSRGAVNVPSSFLVPGYTPGAGGGQTIVRQTNHIRATIEINGVKNTQETVEAIRRELGPVIVKELQKIGY